MFHFKCRQGNANENNDETPLRMAITLTMSDAGEDAEPQELSLMAGGMKYSTST